MNKSWQDRESLMTNPAEAGVWNFSSLKQKTNRYTTQLDVEIKI